MTGGRGKSLGTEGAREGRRTRALCYSLRSGSLAPRLAPPGRSQALSEWASSAKGTPAAACSSSHPPSRWRSSPPGVSCGAKRSNPASRLGGGGGVQEPVRLGSLGALAPEWDSALSAPSGAWGGGGGGHPASPRLRAATRAAGWPSWRQPAPASWPRTQSLRRAPRAPVVHAATSRPPHAAA